MTGRRISFAAGACLSITLAACGSTDRPPTAPSPPSPIDLDYTRTPLELTSDPYLLQLNGFDVTYDGTSRPCTPSGVPSNGKSVTTFLWFVRDGDEWVGRPRPPYASTLAMRLRRTGSSILGVAIEGSIDGSAGDEFDPVMGKIDLVFNVEQDGRVEGMATPAAASGGFPSRLAGTLRGHFSFANSAREVATCTSAQFYLEPRVQGLASAGWSWTPSSDGAAARRIGAGVPPRQREPGRLLSKRRLISLAFPRFLDLASGLLYRSA